VLVLPCLAPGGDVLGDRVGGQQYLLAVAFLVAGRGQDLDALEAVDAVIDGVRGIDLLCEDLFDRGPVAGAFGQGLAQVGDAGVAEFPACVIKLEGVFQAGVPTRASRSRMVVAVREYTLL
jgi:hypothetical protein